MLGLSLIIDVGTIFCPDFHGFGEERDCMDVYLGDRYIRLSYNVEPMITNVIA